MGLFFGRKMDISAAKAFWDWFENQESWIVSKINTCGMEVVYAIDARIKGVFPYFKREPEFQLGYNNGVGEFFFHFNDSRLVRDSNALGEMMPEGLKSRWKFICEA